MFINFIFLNCFGSLYLFLQNPRALWTYCCCSVAKMSSACSKTTLSTAQDIHEQSSTAFW